MRKPTAGGSREAILEALKEGPLQDASGRATGLLFDKIDYRGSSSGLSQLLSAMERDGLITRNINGKRCYEIRLGEHAVAHRAVPGAAATIASAPPPAASREAPTRPAWNLEPVAAPAATPPPTSSSSELTREPAPEPAAGLSARDIATHLLELVVTQAARPLEYEETKRRLAAALDEAQRLRVKTREAEDLAAARAAEIDGLRQRLRDAQRNLDALTKGDNRISEASVRRLREITALMAAPGSNKATQ